IALILLCSKRLATFWDTEKDQAMLHQNSVFDGLLKHVPWHRFDSLVEDHGAEARVRRLSKEPVCGAALWPAFGCGELARDRDRTFEPCGAALPCGRGPGSAVDLLGCERTATCRSVLRLVGDDDEAGPSRTAPQAR